MRASVAVALASAAVGLAGCTLLFEPADPSGADASVSIDAVVPDVAESDTRTNVDSFQMPYTCDEGTIALYRFNGPDPLADACGESAARLEHLSNDGLVEVAFGSSGRAPFKQAAEIRVSGILAAERAGTTAFVNEFAVEAWFRMVAEQPVGGSELDLISAHSLSGAQFTVTLAPGDDTGSRVVVRFYEDDCLTGPAQLLDSGFADLIPAGKWTHFRAEIRGSGATSLFVDGIELAQTTATTNGVADFCRGAGTLLTIGGRLIMSEPPVLANSLSADIDEVRLSSDLR